MISTVPLKLELITAMTPLNRMFCIAGFTLGRMGVPLFLMLTGYLLLPRVYEQSDIKHFYKHNFLPLLVVWEIWIFVYQVYSSWFDHLAFDFAQYIRRALFLQHAGLPHTWYMPVIIGLYLFLPFVSIALHKMDGKTIGILLTVSYIYIFVVPAINLFQTAYQIPEKAKFAAQLDVSYSGGTYGIYLVCGYLLARYRQEIGKLFQSAKAYFVVAGLGILAFAATVATQLHLYNRSYPYNVWYTFAFMPILGVCGFLLLFRIKLPKCMQHFQTHLSVCSFGIYLIHELILLPLIRFIGNVPHKKMEVIILSVVVYFLSFVIVEILSKIPYVGYLFMRKG